MATALPLTKFAGLLVKTLAKPVSKRIQHEFSRSDIGRGVLVAIGRGAHQLTSRLTIWSAGYRVRTISPLSKEKAIQQGAEFVGESFVLAVSMGTVLYEYNRSAEKEERKAEARRAAATAERRELQKKLQSLDLRLQALEATVEKNKSSIFTYLVGGSSSISADYYVPPPREKLVPIVDDDDDDDDDDNDVDLSSNEKDEDQQAGDAGRDISSHPVDAVIRSRPAPTQPPPVSYRSTAKGEPHSSATATPIKDTDPSKNDMTNQHKSSWWWPF